MKKSIDNLKTLGYNLIKLSDTMLYQKAMTLLGYHNYPESVFCFPKKSIVL